MKPLWCSGKSLSTMIIWGSCLVPGPMPWTIVKTLPLPADSALHEGVQVVETENGSILTGQGGVNGGLGEGLEVSDMPELPRLRNESPEIETLERNSEMSSSKGVTLTLSDSSGTLAGLSGEAAGGAVDLANNFNIQALGWTFFSFK